MPEEAEAIPSGNRKSQHPWDSAEANIVTIWQKPNKHIHFFAALPCKLKLSSSESFTHFEKIYIVPDVHKHLNSRYFLNILRSTLFGLFTIINEHTIHKQELKTNDYLIGLVYDTLMDALTVSYGAMSIKYENTIVETFIHPSRYEDGTVDNRFKEFMLIKNKKLKNKIESLGYEITNYVEKEA